MQRSCVAVIKLVKTLNGIETGNINKTGKLPCFFVHFYTKILQKALHVDLSAAQSQHIGTARKIAGHRISHRPADSAVNALTLFTKIQKCKIPPHAETREEHCLVTLFQAMVNNLAQIFGGAAVIKPRLQVHNTSTGAEIPRQNIPTLCQQCFCQPQYVGSSAMTFQTV